jgi:hypothetical protein
MKGAISSRLHPKRQTAATRPAVRWALGDVVTPSNFSICIFAGLVGQVVVEVLREKLS